MRSMNGRFADQMLSDEEIAERVQFHKFCLSFQEDGNFRGLCRLGKLYFGDDFGDSRRESVRLKIVIVTNKRQKLRMS
jgi:hypothetical protein